MIISLATVICFATYVGFWGYVCGAHLLAFQRHKENFWLSIRVPEMLVAEVVVQFLMGVSAALRQISAESGFEIPCYVMNLVSCLAATLIPYTHAYRAVKAIIVYNHQWRKRYLRYFHARAAQKHIATVTLFGLAVWGASTPFTCCKVNCNIANCFLFSSYYLLLPVGSAVGCVLLVLIFTIYHYDVKDATGCLDELMQITGVLGLVFMPYVGILMVLDWGKVEGFEWERLATGLLLLSAALNLYFGIVAPAVKYGYDPFNKHSNSVVPEEDLPGGVELGMGGMWALQRLLQAGGGNTTASTTMAATAHSVQSQSLAVSTMMNYSEAASVHQNARALEFDEMLCTPEIKEAFLAYCSRHLCYEHIMFIIDVEELMCQPTDTREQRDAQKKRLLEIAERYIRFGSTHDLGLNYRLANAVIRQLQLFHRRKVVFLDEYRAYTQAVELIQRRIKKKMVGTVFSQFRRTTGHHFFALDHSLSPAHAGSPSAEARTNPIHTSVDGAGDGHGRGSVNFGGSDGGSGEGRAYHQQRAAVDMPNDDLVVPFVTDTLNLDDEDEDGPAAKPKVKAPTSSLSSSVRAILSASLRSSQPEKQPPPPQETSTQPVASLPTVRQEQPPPPHIDTQDQQGERGAGEAQQTSVFRQVRAAASSLMRWGQAGGQEAKTLPLSSTSTRLPASPSPVISPDVTLRRTRGAGAGGGEAGNEDVVRLMTKTGSLGVVAFDSDMTSEPSEPPKQTSRVQFV